MNADPVAPPDDKIPARGELGIAEKRSWKTWQLVTGIVVAALVGMAIDHYFDKGSNSPNKSNAAAYTPPPASGSSGSSTTTPAAGGQHNHFRCWRQHNDVRCWWFHVLDHNIHRNSRTSAHSSRTYPITRKLDESALYGHSLGLEYRVGLQVHSGADGGSFIPGIGGPRRHLADRGGDDQ